MAKGDSKNETRDQKPAGTLAACFEKWLERARLRWKAKHWGKQDRETEEAVGTRGRRRTTQVPWVPWVRLGPLGALGPLGGVLPGQPGERMLCPSPRWAGTHLCGRDISHCSCSSIRKLQVEEGCLFGGSQVAKGGSRNLTCLHVLSPERLCDFLVCMLCL